MLQFTVAIWIVVTILWHHHSVGSVTEQNWGAALSIIRSFGVNVQGTSAFTHMKYPQMLPHGPIVLSQTNEASLILQLIHLISLGKKDQNVEEL